MHKASVYKNLRLLWWLRCIAIGGQAAAVLVVTHALQIPLQTAPLWAIIGALVLVNAFTWWRLSKTQHIPEGEFFAQLLIDICALAGLLYFSGGATNPFASLFILQVIIAAITLSPAYTWIVAALTIAFYTALLFWNVEVPYFMHHHIGDFFNMHVQGMWISFVLLALIVSAFVVRMNAVIRRQAVALADAEKIAAIGALAANAAHELGTPLATLTILAEQTGDNAPVFREQLARCKQILSRITAAGGVVRAESGAPMALDAFLQETAARWKADHPAVFFTSDLQPGPSPRITAEYGLEQAIKNLLDNAADASPQFVALHATWSAQALTITIRDKGAGVPSSIETGITTKAGGLGLGLFLARSVIQRLDGTLSLNPAEGGGIVAAIILPLKRLAL